MSRDIRQVIKAIDAIDSIEDVAQLQSLELAIDEYFAHPHATAHLGVWFRLFERFPEDDGYEMFWSILHGIESLPDYEPELIASLERRPSRFPVKMVNRMLNAGQAEVEGIDLLSLLKSIAVDKTCLAGVRDEARRFLEYQGRRA